MRSQDYFLPFLPACPAYVVEDGEWSWCRIAFVLRKPALAASEPQCVTQDFGHSLLHGNVGGLHMIADTQEQAGKPPLHSPYFGKCLVEVSVTGILLTLVYYLSHEGIVRRRLYAEACTMSDASKEREDGFDVFCSGHGHGYGLSVAVGLSSG